MGRPPCCDKANVKKGPWTADEDAKLLAYTSTHGIGNWTSVPQKAGLKRCGKSCRLRYTNYLRPNLKHENFTPEEEEHIVTLHAMIGSRWSIIANSLPGRTDNDVKNYWNTKLSKKLSQSGIDPVTHRPISDVMLSIHRLSHPQSLPLPSSPSSSSTITATKTTTFNRELKNAFLTKTNIGVPHHNTSSASSFMMPRPPLLPPLPPPAQTSPVETTWTDFLVDGCDFGENVASSEVKKENNVAATCESWTIGHGWYDCGMLYEEGSCSNFLASGSGEGEGSSSFVDAILDHDKEMASEFPQLPICDSSDFF
ncbi:hypothetical protein LUZ63_007561 [Rhynchospora breviuscula]|uniref:Uncharacterized protein n=1 Tax=Rhynchospora breviuscula TaxID=2022672 RepID=A0A9Q0CT55_9POAL|nr:hypothetical protein LUZ63_007561 [Rhynchospora breviuscula]